MIKKHLKKGKKKAAEVARETAKQIGSELVEIPKQTAREALGTKKTQDSSVILEAMKLKTKEDLLDKDGRSTKPKKLDYLEKELEELKKKGEMEEMQRQQILKKNEVKKEPSPFIEPPAKKKKGLPIFGKKTPKGSGEIMKSKK